MSNNKWKRAMSIWSVYYSQIILILFFIRSAQEINRLNYTIINYFQFFFSTKSLQTKKISSVFISSWQLSFYFILKKLWWNSVYMKVFLQLWVLRWSFEISFFISPIILVARISVTVPSFPISEVPFGPVPSILKSEVGSYHF